MEIEVYRCIKCSFLIQQKSQKSRPKSSIDADVNTGDADFWNGKNPFKGGNSACTTTLFGAWFG